MAKNLKNYKRKELNCIIFENFVTGEVKKVTDVVIIKNIEKKYNENEITHIYNPTQEQKNEIINTYIMADDKSINMNVQANDMIEILIPMLTDIIVDTKDPEQLALLREIIKDPDSVFGKVVFVLQGILIDIYNDWIESIKTLSKVPEDLLNVISEKLEIEKADKEDKNVL